MRLKTIPEGTVIVSFENHTKKDAILTFKWPNKQKEQCVFVKANQFVILDSRNWIVGLPMKNFPRIQVWSNTYVQMDFLCGEKKGDER